MHAWIVFLQVLAVFGFLIAHGVSAVVAFTQLRERNLKPMPVVPPAPRDELDAILAKAKPALLTVIGYGGAACSPG